MEMESGSTPRSVLLSKGSKMSSRMLAGCKTYPHWPLDMNKAWFICMGLSGEHRQELEGGQPVPLPQATSPGLSVPRVKPFARGPGPSLGNASCAMASLQPVHVLGPWGDFLMHDLPNYPVLHGSPPSFPPSPFSFPCAGSSICQTAL